MDTHLIDNLAKYIDYAKVFKEILLEMKYFPYPLTIIKTYIYKYFQEKGYAVTITINNNINIKKNINKEKSEIIEETNPKQQQIQKNISTKININGEELLNKLKENITNIGIKSIFKNYVQIESIIENKINFRVINEMQYKILIKTENIELIKNLCCQLLDTSGIVIQFSYISKEDYFKKMSI